MPALRRGLRMGRNLYHAVRTEGGVPEFDRLLELRDRRRLTQSRALADEKSSEPAESPAPCFFGPARTIFAAMIALLVPLLTVCSGVLAAETSTTGEKTPTLSGEKTPSDEYSESAC